jgi:cell division protein FtsZ
MTPPSAVTQPGVPTPAADEGGMRRRWIAPGGEAPAQAEPAPTPGPRVKLGGTLFERMSNAARGAPREEEDKSSEPLDIPRFLHRQNNQ